MDLLQLLLQRSDSGAQNACMHQTRHSTANPSSLSAWLPILQLERARRLAGQYAAAALQSRPKLKLHLELDAPKVAIPIKDARGRATLALDFGRCVIESGAKLV